MIKKYFAVSIIAASIAMAGCSSDDDDKTTTGGTTDGGTTDGGTTDGGTTDGGTTDGGTTDGGTVTYPPATPGVGATAYDFLVNNPDDYSQLVGLIDGAGLADRLDDDTMEYTVFAPNNAAFTSEVLDVYTAATPEAQARILAYHVVEGSRQSGEIIAGVAAVAEGEAPYFLPTLADADPAQNLTFTALEAENTETTYSITDGNGTVVPLAGPLDQNLSTEVGAATTGIVHQLQNVLLPAPATPGGTTDGGTTDGGTTDGGAGGSAFADLFAGEAPATFSGAIAAIEAESFEDKFTLPAGAEEGDPWTVFMSTDEALAGADWVLRDHFVQGTAFTEEALLAASPLTSFNGGTFTIGGTVGALTLNGNPIKLVNLGASAVYRLDGVIPAQ